MKTLEEKLGYTFQDRSLLENALTHSSYANEHRAAGVPEQRAAGVFGGLHPGAWWWPTTCTAPTPTCRRGT